MSLLQLWLLAVSTGGTEVADRDSPAEVPQPRTYNKIKKIISSYVKGDKMGLPTTFDSHANPSFQEPDPVEQNPASFTNPTSAIPSRMPNSGLNLNHGTQTVHYGPGTYPSAPFYGHAGAYPTAPSYGPGGYPTTSQGPGTYPSAHVYGPGTYPVALSYGAGAFPTGLSYGPGMYPTAPSYGPETYHSPYASTYQRVPAYGAYKLIDLRNYRAPLYNSRMPFTGNTFPSYQVALHQRYGF